MATISKTIRGHVIELAPTGEQIIYFKKACGTARFAYNWGLSTWDRMWKEYKRGDLGTDGKRVPKPNEALIRKMLNELKKDKYPWMYDVTKCAPQQAIKNLGRACQSPATYPELTFRLEVGACKSPIDQRAWRYAKQTLYAGSRPTAECFLSSALWKSKQQTSRRTVRNGFGQNAGV